MIKAAPRVVIAGTGSGCGKTTAVCAILAALVRRGCAPVAFKCGPDYIDPMFHSEIIGTASANIDLFFADRETARALFMRHAGELNLIEGVMGYYDGLSMADASASSWDVACALDAPAVLVVNGRGMGLSVAAVVRGFQQLRPDSRIAGVILNHTSPMSYPKLAEVIRRECGVEVYGYLPECPDCALESRHLGLVTAAEVGDLQKKMAALAVQAEKTLRLDALVELMRAQPPLEAQMLHAPAHPGVRIAVARDRACCFYYRDNLELLQDMGAELVEFSPIADECLPACDGLILGGGYPELYLEALGKNSGMLESLRVAVAGGLPTLAECGGFMLLTKSIDGTPMAGALDAECKSAGRLTRFGYATFTAKHDNLLLEAGDAIRGHEFHYWDADFAGDALAARKPNGREWACGYATDTLYAGYPHLYLYSNPRAAERFYMKCLDWRQERSPSGKEETI